MKKNLLLIFVLVTSLVACKKDATETNADRLIGRWIVEQVSEVNYENGVEKQKLQNSAQNDNQICEFRSDGTATVNLDGGDVEVTWTVTGSNLVLTTDEVLSVNFNILNLNENRLLLEFEDDVEVQNGITYRNTLEFKMRK